MPKEYRNPKANWNAAPGALLRASRLRLSSVIRHSTFESGLSSYAHDHLAQRGIRGRFQRGLLRLEELPDARFAKSQHLAQLAVVERGFFAGALQLDEFPGLGHNYVKVHLRRRVFHITKVQHDCLVKDAHTDGGD